jgi:hypothetical protein
MTIPAGQKRDEERRYKAEALALGYALQDALRDLVHVHGLQYLDTFLARRIRLAPKELGRDEGLNIAGVLAAQRSRTDDAEAALRRAVECVRRDPEPLD